MYQLKSKIRDVNVRVSPDSPPIFYEFKSTQTVPPQHFVQQFTIDLQLEAVTDLNQVKWYFDANEVSSLNKADFVNELAANKTEIFNSKAKGLFEDYLDATFIDADDMITSLNNSSDWFDAIFHIK